ncbi:MAG: dienelactone hydrolase family protein [Pseudonocardiaceae bacterium]
MAMTECRTEQLRVPDGSELQLTIVEPESVVRGGIVVFHEARGITDTVRTLAEGLADEGWLALVPHLYHSDGADQPTQYSAEQVHRHIERLSADSVLAHTDASLGWLTARDVSTDRIGVLGFGLGGTVALIIATQRDLGAAVTIDGIGVIHPVCPALPAMVEVAPELRCPWLGVYGSNVVAQDEVGKLQDAVHSAQVATDLVFFTDTHRVDTVHSAGAEAWTRTLNWFDSHLR